MPLVINMLPHVDRPDPPVKAIVADRRLYLAGDETTLVEHGDVEARYLLAPAGGAITSPDVERLHLSLVDGRVVQNATTPETKRSAPDEDKQSAPDADKMLKPDANKSAAAPASTGKRERK